MDSNPEKQVSLPVERVYSSNVDPHDIQLSSKSAALQTKDGQDVFIGSATLTYGSIVISAEEIRYSHRTRTAELYIYNENDLPIRSATIILTSNAA